MASAIPNDETLKQREIRFCAIDPAAEPAREAARLLMGVPGIHSAETLARDCLRLRYDLRQIGLQLIENALAELGFHLDNSLLSRMKRALVHYCEETQLANMGRSHDKANATLDIFINSYQQRPHGCRDGRPRHLRDYA